ncbi:MAG: DUF1990 domain-containing protein [Actinomycetota bacterium]|nr:DUF1990 domain-containing protein [Rubrobacter sp.]MBA3789846.1 DUF1990 domain-containing protein [Rubrobacter sp.]MDQ3568775.1 DUF1990 domain-containing protein [Actinomycetota bacterium]
MRCATGGSSASAGRACTHPARGSRPVRWSPCSFGTSAFGRSTPRASSTRWKITGPIQRFGFAYGTLPGHSEKGEELFSIEWDREEGSVHYAVFAFSRPNHPLAWLGYPFTRMLQKRFIRDSQRAMVEASAPANIR